MEAGFVSRQSLPYSLFLIRHSLFKSTRICFQTITSLFGISYSPYSLPLFPCSLPLANKVVPLRGHQYDMIMKFIILLLAIYLFYRYFLRQPKALPPQEPDVFVHHEEVKKEHEKNK